MTVLCPKCGAEMVERNGKFGRFWGCPKWPECRGSMSAEQGDAAAVGVDLPARIFPYGGSFITGDESRIFGEHDAMGDVGCK